ncbi:MAG: BON domain-containing protein [Gemmatimonadota bacterium]|nr:BON domain-containing protein [Gemmatimonadota bacterium]
MGSGGQTYRGGVQSQGQGHRGKGPKQYSRSDERIIEDLNERLTDDDDIDASEINVKCENGTVTLEGAVPERWMKHRSEDLVESCSGVKDVENRLQVRREGSDSSRAPRSSASSKGASSEGATDRSGIRAAGSTGSSGSSPH